MVQIKVRDLERYGYTTNCPGCITAMPKDGRKFWNRTPQCRARIEAALAADGDERLIRAEDRIDQWFEEQHPAEQNAETKDEAEGAIDQEQPRAPPTPQQESADVIVDEPVPGGVENLQEGSFDPMDADFFLEVVDQELQFDDRPVGRSEGRLRTPERAPATKRAERAPAASSRETRRRFNVDVIAIDNDGHGMDDGAGVLSPSMSWYHGSEAPQASAPEAIHVEPRDGVDTSVDAAMEYLSEVDRKI